MREFSTRSLMYMFAQDSRFLVCESLVDIVVPLDIFDENLCLKSPRHFVLPNLEMVTRKQR